MMYHVTTPLNPKYDGKTFGVKFNNGSAVITEHTIDRSLGLSADTIAERMRLEFGYTVEPMGQSPTSFTRAIDVGDQMEAETAAKFVPAPNPAVRQVVAPKAKTPRKVRTGRYSPET